MPEKISDVSPTPKKRGRPPKKIVGESNQIQEKKKLQMNFVHTITLKYFPRIILD